MAIDGTYGRLGGHNQRMNNLRRRRKANGGHHFLNPIKVNNVKFDIVDSRKLEIIKTKIQKKAKVDKKREIIAFILSILISTSIIYYILNLSTK